MSDSEDRGGEKAGKGETRGRKSSPFLALASREEEEVFGTVVVVIDDFLFTR